MKQLPPSTFGGLGSIQRGRDGSSLDLQGRRKSRLKLPEGVPILLKLSPALRLVAIELGGSRVQQLLQRNQVLSVVIVDYDR